MTLRALLLKNLSKTVRLCSYCETKRHGHNYVSVSFPTTGHAKNSSYWTRTLHTNLFCLVLFM